MICSRLASTVMVARSVVDRFVAKVLDGTPDECWEWMGLLGVSGYGQFRVDGRPMKPARFAFYLANGYYAEVTRHTCNNNPCCNPGHLVDGTAADNAADMIVAGRHANQQKTSCPRGHPYDRVKTRGDGRTFRACSRCSLDSTHKRRGAEKKRHTGPRRGRAEAS